MICLGWHTFGHKSYEVSVFAFNKYPLSATRCRTADHFHIRSDTLIRARSVLVKNSVFNPLESDRYYDTTVPQTLMLPGQIPILVETWYTCLTFSEDVTFLK